MFYLVILIVIIFIFYYMLLYLCYKYLFIQFVLLVIASWKTHDAVRMATPSVRIAFSSGVYKRVTTQTTVLCAAVRATTTKTPRWPQRSGNVPCAAFSLVATGAAFCMTTTSTSIAPHTRPPASRAPPPAAHLSSRTSHRRALQARHRMSRRSPGPPSLLLLPPTPFPQLRFLVPVHLPYLQRTPLHLHRLLPLVWHSPI